MFEDINTEFKKRGKRLTKNTKLSQEPFTKTANMDPAKSIDALNARLGSADTVCTMDGAVSDGSVGAVGGMGEALEEKEMTRCAKCDAEVEMDKCKFIKGDGWCCPECCGINEDLEEQPAEASQNLYVVENVFKRVLDNISDYRSQVETLKQDPDANEEVIKTFDDLCDCEQHNASKLYNLLTKLDPAYVGPEGFEVEVSAVGDDAEEEDLADLQFEKLDRRAGRYMEEYDIMQTNLNHRPVMPEVEGDVETIPYDAANAKNFSDNAYELMKEKFKDVNKAVDDFLNAEQELISTPELKKMHLSEE